MHRDQEARFHALGKTLDMHSLHVTFTPRVDGTLIKAWLQEKVEG